MNKPRARQPTPKTPPPIRGGRSSESASQERQTKEVLKILEQNARTSHETIATMTGLPLKDVGRIIASAEAKRAIVRYKTIVNWEKLGGKQVTAVIEVKVAPERHTGFDAVAERIYRFPEARSVYLMSGAYDLLVMVTAKDMYEVSRFVSNKLATIEAVTGTVTHFLMRRYKEDSEVFADGKPSRRQPLSP